MNYNPPPPQPGVNIATGEEALRLQKLFGIGHPPARQRPTIREY